ncbi:hypothetical protein K788_0008231 [Paraburkholderia caribensis MBA4]|uniref:Uncharacterized protein n=1 Tax=Paraburkholderia caribensis MBA4 TaxID=1323664 RepID=A0A0N7JUQ8_9BURK|nr:hypothetical protein K788_0008231 [Paraburkholderia caribensis MBA4]
MQQSERDDRKEDCRMPDGAYHDRATPSPYRAAPMDKRKV